MMMLFARDSCFHMACSRCNLNHEPENWSDFARNWLAEYQEPGRIAMLVGGPTLLNPDANHRIEFLRISSPVS